LAFYLDKFVNYEIQYLIVEMPPRHGKSEMVSRRLPAFALGLDPREEIISCSYASFLASKMNRDVQRIIQTPEYSQIFPETKIAGMEGTKSSDARKNNEEFEIVDFNGSYRSAGVGGGITGAGMTLGIIDDYCKNAEEAESETYREKAWEWYTSTFFTRMEGNSRVLITATRWHEDDLIGRVLESEHGKNWKVVKLKAIREDDDNPDDPREPGQALWPDKYPENKLNEIKTAVGSRVFTSLYQQEPTAAGGTIFKREWFRFYDELPKARILRRVQSWDFASKKKEENDFTVCTSWNQYDTGYYLVSFWMEKVAYPEAKKQVSIEASDFKPHNILIEDASAGQQILQELSGPMLPLKAIHPLNDKVLRANQASPVFESRNVYFPINEWIKKVCDQLCGFPNAKYDDIVDSISQFINWARENPTTIAPAASRGTRESARYHSERKEKKPWQREKGGKIDYIRKVTRKSRTRR